MVSLIVKATYGSQLIGSRGSVVGELEKGSGGRIAVERGNGEEKTVEVQGDARSKKLCYERIFAKLEDLGADMRDVNITIPPQSVTALVGKGGSTVKGLQDASGAHINLPRKNSGDAGRVNITGEPHATFRAMLAIDEILQSENNQERVPERRDVGRRDRFESSRRVDVPPPRVDPGQRRGGGGTAIEFLLGGSLARALVGRGGSVVQGIERQTGAKVDVSKGRGVGDDENRVVSIYGGRKADALKIALEQLEDTINEPIASVHFQVPAHSVKLIIGAQGATVNGIQRDAKARIDVPKGDRESGTLTISGTIRQIVRAAEMVYNVVDSDFGGRSFEPAAVKRYIPGVGRAASPPRQRRRVEGPQLELLVSSAMAPRLVGPGGSIVNQISEESGAHVDIDKGNTPMKSVVVTGDDVARRRAADLILSRMDETEGGLNEVRMRIPLKLITSVVGSKGANVKQLEEETHTKIHIARRGGNETPGSVQIVGKVAQILEAIVSIDAVINAREELGKDDE